MTLKPHTRLIVMGTPAFILPTLDRLVQERAENGEPQFDLVAIYTRAPKPMGRGLELSYSPVHKAALELQKTYRLPFEIVTPDTFKKPEHIEKFKSFRPDLVVVGAYGLILPQEVLDTPALGCINLHASLLPYGRGAAPIQRAILEGKDETGLTIMKMDAGCDTGLILKQRVLPITPTTTADVLTKQLAELGPDLLMETLHENPTGIQQDESRATYAKKVTKEEAQIDWDKPAEVVSCHIRAFSPAPGAFTCFKDKKDKLSRLKIYNALMCENTSSAQAGTIIQADHKIVVACAHGALELTDIQSEGKKRTSGKEFCNGHLLTVGDKFLNIDEK